MFETFPWCARRHRLLSARPSVLYQRLRRGRVHPSGPRGGLQFHKYYDGFGSILAGMLLYVFRSRLKRRWRRLKPLWRDALRVLSINVTFAQINCSLPSVIDVDWPPNFIAFVANFNIVNIDLMSLLGTNCISGFSFYASFIFMTLIPVGVAIVGLAEYCASSKLMVRRLQLMTAERKQKKEEEALHLLFKIADADNSGQIDTGELMVILQQLGWKGLDLDVVLRCALQTGAKLNQFGIYTMTERSFVAAMVDGELRNALMEQNKDENSTLVWAEILTHSSQEGISGRSKFRRNGQDIQIRYPLKLPVRLVGELEVPVEICRFHNYDTSQGCIRHREKRCPLDHQHCHWCGEQGHRALECEKYLARADRVVTSSIGRPADNVSALESEIQLNKVPTVTTVCGG